MWNAFFDSAVEEVLRLRRASRALIVEKGTVRENVPADITYMPSQCWMRAMHLPFVDHILQKMDIRLLIDQNHHFALPHTTIAGEYNTRLSSCTRCSKTTCQVICVRDKMEGKMGDGECR